MTRRGEGEAMRLSELLEGDRGSGGKETGALSPQPVDRPGLLMLERWSCWRGRRGRRGWASSRVGLFIGVGSLSRKGKVTGDKRGRREQVGFRVGRQMSRGVFLRKYGGEGGSKDALGSSLALSLGSSSREGAPIAVPIAVSRPTRATTIKGCTNHCCFF